MSEQTSTVFGATSDQGAAGGSGTQDDPVTLLVGEGKKFKTVQELAKGKLESDAFIAKLTEENKALRATAGSDTTSIEAKLEQLLAAQKGSGPASQPTSNQSQSEPLTTEKVLDLLEKREQARKLQENSDHFNSMIAKALGPKAAETVMQRLNDLGLDLNTFNGIVANNPQSALKLVGVREASTATSGDISGKSGGANTAALLNPANNGNGVKNHAYFNRLRQELGQQFYTPAIQQEMIKARKEMGPDYFK